MKTQILKLMLVLSSFIFASSAFGDPTKDLFTAAAKGDMDGAKRAIEQGGDPTFENSDKMAPYAVAFDEGHTQVGEYLYGAFIERNHKALTGTQLAALLLSTNVLSVIGAAWSTQISKRRGY